MNMRPMHETPGFAEEFAAIVAGAAREVCAVCGLQILGHGPESQWLGHARHAWQPRPATAQDVDTARRLTGEAYRARANA